MATVHIDDDTPTREVIHETQVTSDNGGTALTILALLLIAIIAVGAYLYYNGTSTVPINRTVNHVERNVSDATTGDAGGATTTRSTTTTTQ
ncbi:hypothetical protein [Asticcacaulis solisilvae]|uniref:hypothetical protein n=1 Tax=Asticcacaulis solisilvae TaxID=1217274 RepID=UPI003FD7EB7D